MAEPEPELLTPAPAVEAVEAKIGECVLTDAFPVSFELALDEVTATAKGGELEAPRPYIGHISRQAYLPLVFKQLREHFADSMPPQCGGDMWCSTGDGTPLKWHRPSGVLFDLHGSPDVLPWRLIVHFSKFPQDQLLSPCQEDDVQQHFMNTVKEAVFLQYGSTQPLTSMPIEQQTQLWESIMEQNVRRFSEVAAAIRPSDVKHVPLRILVPGRPAAVQAPITPTDQSGAGTCIYAGQPRTLGQVLGLLLPGTEISEEDEHGVGFPWPAARRAQGQAQPNADDGAGPGPFIAVVQGVRPALRAPVQRLWELLHHPDQFLYVCLKPIL